MTVQQLIDSIGPASEPARAEALRRWDAVAKPLGGLGLLEDQVARIAAAQHSAEPDIGARSLIVLCADNGVVDEGVTQAGYDVTATMAIAIAEGKSSVCRMAQAANVSVLAVDMGAKRRLAHPNLLDRHLMDGTASIARGPAMARELCERAVLIGAELVVERARGGCKMVLMGELGMGNTTTSAAVACALLGASPKELVGRGAGLSDEGLRRKVAAVKRALAINRPDPGDPMDVLAKVGGLDIAGLVGAALGCAMCHIPVVLDGAIAGVAALAAARMCPDAAGYMLASHVSAEPASERILAELALDAPIHAGLHLGEGTGAVALVPMLDMALRVYREALTFAEADIAQYARFVREDERCSH